MAGKMSLASHRPAKHALAHILHPLTPRRTLWPRNAPEVELGARTTTSIESPVIESSSAVEKEGSSIFLSDKDPENSQHEILEGSRKAVKNDQTEGILTAWRKILGSTESATFFAAVGLSGMGMGLIDTFLFIWLEELGGNHLLCGVARLVMCLAEVPFFSISGMLTRRVGVRGMIAITQAAYLMRLIYYSVLEDPWWVLPAELLHGLTFAAMWTATTTYAHMIAPESLHSTFQGLAEGIHSGLGVGLGAIMGGVLYADLGARKCFFISAILPSLSLALISFPVLQRQWQEIFKPAPAQKDPLNNVGRYELFIEGDTTEIMDSSERDDDGKDSQDEEKERE